jgi:hypothetical protein
MTDLDAYFQQLVATSGQLLVLGDFNVNVDEQNNKAAVFMDFLGSLNLVQHVREPTHIGGHTLDHVLTPAMQTPPTVTVDAVHSVSDHFPIYCTLQLRVPKAESRWVSYRAFKKVDQTEFSADVLRAFTLNNDADSPDSLADRYNEAMSRVVDKHAPLKVASVPVRYCAEWYNDSLRHAKQERRQAERRWRKSGLTVHREAFEDKRNEVNRMVKDERSAYYKDMIESHKDDPRKLFRSMFDLLGKKKQASLPSGRSDNDMATEFCDYFTAKVRDVRQGLQVNDAQGQQLPAALPPPNRPSSTLHAWQPVSTAQVKRIIMQSPTKQCALDPLPTSLLKLSIDSLIHPITDIINASLSSGVVPGAFKIARVTPMIKKPSLDPALLANYRPVSNLPFLSKALERVVNQQLTQHLTRNDLQDPMQSAYRAHHSTETALIRVQHDIITAMSEKRACLLVLLDLSCAFDTVDHDILINTLAEFGIAGVALEWFRSYLDMREQYVAVGDARSPSTHLEYGVPQGSVLGPTLFVIYTASVGRLLRSSGVNYHLYADDSSLYVTFDPGNLGDAIDVVHNCLNAVQELMTNLKLRMNSSKTEVILISSKPVAKQLPGITSFVVGDDPVSLADAVRYIGVFLDCHLTMEQHINSVCKACMIHLASIGRIRKMLSRKSCEHLIHALITTKLDYANAVLYGLPNNLLRKLQRVQNIAARIVTYTPRTAHITPVLQSLHWLPVQARIDFKICLVVFKCLHGRGPEYLRELLLLRHPPRDLRSVPPLEVPISRSAIAERAFGFAAPKLWNSLPQGLRETDSIDVFKKRLKTFLFTKTYL